MEEKEQDDKDREDDDGDGGDDDNENSGLPGFTESMKEFVRMSDSQSARRGHGSGLGDHDLRSSLKERFVHTKRWP